MAEQQLGVTVTQGDPKAYPFGSKLFRRGSVAPEVAQIKDLLLKFFINLKTSNGQNLEIPKEILALKPSQEAAQNKDSNSNEVKLYQTFGPMTEAAVKVFQEWYRKNVNPTLLVDGKIKEQTWSALNSTFTDNIVPEPLPPLKVISGQIRDYNTEQPLSGVTVRFNPDPNNKREVKTDKDGNFFLYLTEKVVFYAGVTPDENIYNPPPKQRTPTPPSTASAAVPGIEEPPLVFIPPPTEQREDIVVPPTEKIYPTNEYIKYTDSYINILNDKAYNALDPTFKKEILEHLKITFDYTAVSTYKENGKEVTAEIPYVYKGAKTLSKDRLNYITPLTAEGEWIYDLKTIYLVASPAPDALDIAQNKQITEKERKKLLNKPDAGVISKALNQTLDIVRDRLNNYVTKLLSKVGIQNPYLIIDAVNDFDLSIQVTEDKNNKYKASINGGTKDLKSNVSSSYSELKNDADNYQFPNPFKQTSTEQEETSTEKTNNIQTVNEIDPFTGIPRVSTIDDIEIPEPETPPVQSLQSETESKEEGNRNLEEKIKILVARGILLLPKKCPADAKGLMNIIDARNKLTSQLNNINTVLDFNVKSVQFLNTLLEGYTVAKISAIASYSALPAPAATVTTGVISAQETTKNELLKSLDKLVDQIKSRLEPIEKTVFFILVELNKILTLLNLLDIIIKDCAGEEKISLETINDELIKSTNKALLEGNTIDTEYKGFKIEVQTEETDSPYKRRYAQAIDTFGVVVLTGPKSFSSSPQILINELKFQIDSKGLGEPPAAIITNPLPKKSVLPPNLPSNVPPPRPTGNPEPIGYLGKTKGERAYVPIGNGSIEDVYEWTGNSWVRTGEQEAV